MREADSARRIFLGGRGALLDPTDRGRSGFAGRWAEQGQVQSQDSSRYGMPIHPRACSRLFESSVERRWPVSREPIEAYLALTAKLSCATHSGSWTAPARSANSRGGAASRLGIPTLRARSMEPRPGIRIPPYQLAPETLRSIIEEFVTRDGTDLVEAETKVRKVATLLQHGEVEIWFDEATRSCNILPA